MNKIFVYLDIIGPLLALPFYLQSKSKGEGYLFLLYFLLLQLLLNGLAKTLWLTGSANNIYVYQLNAFFSCLLVTFYILQELKKICGTKLIYGLWIYAVSSFIVLLVMIILEDTSLFNSLSYTFTGFTICVFCVIFYLQSLINLKEENLIRSTGFWAITAFFLYYNLSFFIFMYYKVFTRFSGEDFQVLWGIHNFVLFFSCFLLIIAIKQR